MVKKLASSGRVAPQIGADFLSAAKVASLSFELVEAFWLKYRCTRWATNYIEYSMKCKSPMVPGLFTTGLYLY